MQAVSSFALGHCPLFFFVSNRDQLKMGRFWHRNGFVEIHGLVKFCGGFMQAVILAGGMATRLGELSKSLPKSLMDVNGIPFLFHQINMLKYRGVTELVLCTGHLGEMIEEYAGNGDEFGVKIRYSRDGSTLRGTGGAIKNALPFVNDQFFVINGDTYLPIDLNQIDRAFSASEKLGIMAVFKNQDRWDTSNVIMNGNLVEQYVKNGGVPNMHFIDAGIVMFKKSVFIEYPFGDIFPLEDVYVKLIQSKEMAGFETDQRFFEIGSKAGLQEIRDLAHSGVLPN